ncbi:hypothetical protein N7517_003607, partial [Penicillium concentricum]
FGDYVKDEEQEPDLEELVEPWHRYDAEDNEYVLYPIRLGEVLNERYLVEHKLGFGGGSTVWMAFDQQDKREVALKVMDLGKWGDNETRIQDEIIKTVQDTSRLVIYTATFFLPRDDKTYHRVLVFPVKGPSICTLTLRKSPMASRMSAARQLLETVAGSHEAGIIHRDLNARNCMWGMAPIDSLDRSTKYELLGRPLKQTIPFVELWNKGELVSPVKFPKDLLRLEEFYLCDFGSAKKIGNVTTQCGYPPMHYCSPDRLYNLSSGKFSLHTVVDLIHENDLTTKLAYFRPDADLVERQLVHSIMSKVFVYQPEKRPTAVELLRDLSFSAIMERYEC